MRADLQIADGLFAALRRMDAEATTVRDGLPTGLYWYGGHAKPDQTRPQTEPLWSKRSAEYLSENGFEAQAEVTYPNQDAGRRQRCDVVVTSGDRRFWIEIKCADKKYWTKQGSIYIYRSYLLHPLLPDLDPKTHTAATDLAKLEMVGHSDATDVGFLLLGFDDPADPMDDDIDEFMRLSGVRRPPWNLVTDAWDDPYRENQRTRCWFWSRPCG